MARPRTRRSPTSTRNLDRAADWTNPRVVQILDAASRCFEKSGFANTTVQEIADEAGMTKSMIHYYFENKQALIGELQAFVYERYLRKVQTRLLELGSGTEGRAHEALMQAFEIVRDKSFLRLQLELLAEAGRDPEIMKRLAALQARSRGVVAEGVNAVLGSRAETLPISKDVLSALISAVLHGLRVFEYVEGEAAPTQEAYELFIGLLMIGMKAVSPEESA